MVVCRIEVLQRAAEVVRVSMTCSNGLPAYELVASMLRGTLYCSAPDPRAQMTPHAPINGLASRCPNAHPPERNARGQEFLATLCNNFDRSEGDASRADEPRGKIEGAKRWIGSVGQV